ncbi:MAG: ribulose-phosphate 3-epimerase, partial [Dehalococcoidia bacterium]
MASEVAVKLAPSILSADFARLGEQVAEVTRAGADYIHVDVMDGRFVPNLTVGPVVVEALRRWTHLPLDVHLMIVEPERLLEEFIKAGASHIIVHVEATLHLHRLVQRVREAGLKVGVALNPSTPLSAVEEVLPSVDVVVVSTVNPGFAGQALIPEMLQKVRRLRDLLDERGYQAEIQVDGGINAETVPRAVQAGARILVAGSAI